MSDQFTLDPERALHAIQQGAQSTIDRITEAVRPHAPVGKGRPDGYEGGGLRDGLAGKVIEQTADGVSMAVISDKEYAKYVVKGTPPHVIEARNAKALRFWVDGDHLVFAQHVNHPGTAANPFYRQAKSEITAIVREDVRTAMRRMLRP